MKRRNSKNSFKQGIEQRYLIGVERNSFDTTYVNYQVENWSLRALGIFKDLSFQIRENDNRVNYVPRNRSGVGLGAAYFPFLLDLSINIKTRNKEPTSRFDAQFDIILQRHLIGTIIQKYSGFEVRNSLLDQNQFRPDIESFNFMTTYAYLFSSQRLSVGSTMSGLHQQKKSAGSFSFGGFVQYTRVKGDSSLIPSEIEQQFSGDTRIQKYQQFGIGVVGAYGHIFRLPGDFFIFLGAMPGIGIAWKQMEYENQAKSQPVDPFIYRIHFRLSFGYNGSKFYIVLTGGDDISGTRLGSNSYGFANVAKSKLVFGWKFKK